MLCKKKKKKMYLVGNPFELCFLYITDIERETILTRQSIFAVIGINRLLPLSPIQDTN